MTNTTQGNAASMIANAAGEKSVARWVRTLAVMIREHALAHRAATASALHRRSVAELRQLYLRSPRREETTSKPVNTVAGAQHRSTGRPYLTAPRHSFGK
jgi:hypothetical protein